MKLHLCKQYGQLIPATPQDAEYLETIKHGEVIHAEFKKMRNGKHHRKFFAMLNLVYENQSKYPTLEDMLTELKIRVGHYREMILSSGELVYTPKSVSFASMGQNDFEIFYNKCINALLRMLPQFGLSSDRIDMMVNQLVSA